MTEPISPAAVVLAARLFIDVPFQHQGRNRAGIDCVGLIVMVARECGIPIEDFPDRNYSRFPTAHRHLATECDRQLVPITDGFGEQPGDIILFWVHRRTIPQHLGIYTGHERIVHAWYEAKRVMETSMGPYWSDRIYATYRYPGVL